MPLTQLERAREVVAAYMDYRGFDKDREYLVAGKCDYSTDVQCALIAIIMVEDKLTPQLAAVRARFLPYEEGSPSKQDRVNG